MLRTSLIVNRASSAVVALVPTFALVLLACPSLANADDFSLKLEPGVSESLTAPQSQIYATGGGQSLKALFGLTPYLDVGPSASFLFLPASAERAEAGVVWGFGAGMRFKLPHDRESYHGVSPWFDADLLYMRTGGLNRPGFDAAIGLAVPVGESRNFWVGPFVRYLHTVELERTGYDSRDAKTLIVGLSLEVGSGIERKRIPSELQESPPVEPIAAATVSCGDRDHDGIADNIDRCPDVAGLMANDGCPNYDKLVVKKDKLELKEKLYFAWDKAKIEDASFPVLDEVVKALKENLSFRVQVEGHTDSSGPDAHNQTLSEQRAQAVLAYLTAHDVAQDRLVSKGFSSSLPLDTNDTAAGRENNRRVEFVVSFIILNDGSPQ